VQTIANAADVLIAREQTRTTGERITVAWPHLDLETAYAIQDETLRRRVSRGERLAGIKLGLTSEAKQRQMGISSPVVAWLTDQMRLPTDEPLGLGEFIHPRIEPEIAFVMASALKGPGVTAEQALEAVGTVHSAAEVIDSRFAGFNFTLPDVVADNASAAGFMLSESGRPPEEVDLAIEPVTVERDGVVTDTAIGAAVMGHPALALAFAANQLATRGLHITSGRIVLTGGLTDAVPMAPGNTIVFSFGSLDSIAVEVRMQ
jgi:2-oxo-3-hexenedioate decarboxylase